jgi:hypothetical protein
VRIELPHQAVEEGLEAAFPRWVRAQTYVRNTVVFAGSAAALVAVSLA